MKTCILRDNANSEFTIKISDNKLEINAEGLEFGDDDFEFSELKDALNQSLKLQSHYAELLNMHDNGERMCFIDIKSWIKRLRELRS